MSEEILVPRMTRLDKRKRKIKIPIINIVTILFGTLLLVLATFININIQHYIIPKDLFTNSNLAKDSFVYSFYLIPQIPIIMFLTSTLGKKMSTVSLFIYIILGLFILPIFALGGGIRYIGQFGFGYILAYIPASIIAGNYFEQKGLFLKLIKGTLLGVLTIHITGILYMILIAICKHSGSTFIGGWIAAQSGLKIVYDIIFSFTLALIGQFLNKGLTYIKK